MIYSYELFTFKNICKKELFIKKIFRRIFLLNIFIKQCIHKENIFIGRVYSIFLCARSLLLLLETEGQNYRHRGDTEAQMEKKTQRFKFPPTC